MNIITKLGAAWRSFHNPNTPLSDPDLWLTDALGGGSSEAGINVNEATALTYSSVWRAVNQISRDIAKLPIDVHERSGTGKVKAKKHPAYRILRWHPNQAMTAFNFWQSMMKSVLLHGNAYAWISRAKSGKPVDLIPLNPGTTFPVMEGTRISYLSKANGKDRRLEAADVLHIRGLGDGFAGMSVIAHAKDSIGLGLAASRYGSKFFANGARPGVVLIHPQRLTPEAQAMLKKSWNSMHKGIDNAEKTAVLQEGMSIETVSVNNDDAQFLETRQFEVREIANWFNMPPHKLGDASRTSFASLEQENQAYLDDTLDPWMVNIEQECRAKLLTTPQIERDNHAIEFNREAIIRVNFTDKVNGLNMGVAGGWLSRDEARARLNMNPIPGGAGAEFFSPLNMGVAGDTDGADAGQAQDTDAAEGQQDGARAEALRAVVMQATGRMARRIASQARKKSRDADGFIAWLDDHMDADQRELVRGEFAPVVAAVGGDIDEAVGGFFDECRRLLDEATKVPSERFAAAIEQVTAIIERDLPDTITDTITGGA